MSETKEDFLNEFVGEVRKKGIGGLVGLYPKDGESKEDFKVRCIEVIKDSFWYSERGHAIDIENIPSDKF